MDRHRAAVRTVESSSALLPADAASESESEAGGASAMLNTAVLLWRQRASLCRATASGGLLTLFVVLLIPNTYQSSTHLMSPDMRGGSSDMAIVAGLLAKSGGGLGGLTSNLFGMNNAGDLLVSVLRSRSVGDNLIQRFDLKKVYSVRGEEDARAELADRTEISQDRKSGTITISVVDRDPHRAADITHAYVDDLNRLLVEVSTSAAHRERLFIEERLKVARQELDVAATRLSDFSTKNTTLDPKEQGRAMVGAAVSLQGELIAQETELRGLQQIYADNNVRVKAMQARITELRRQLENLRGTDPEPASVSVEKAGTPYPNFRRLPALDVAYADFYREVKLQETVFETLTQQYELARIAEAKEIPSVKVLDPANLPEKKSGPPRVLITLFGALVSLALGSVLVIGKAVWEQADPADPRRKFVAEIWEDTRPTYSALQARSQRMRTRLRSAHCDSNSKDGQHS